MTIINCDMGEGFGLYRIGDDEGLMPLIDVANVACGFHASDFNHMRRTVQLAKANGVKVGAHPSLGERIAELWLRENLLPLPSRDIDAVQAQVTNPCGAQGLRCDFLVTHRTDGQQRAVEVKTVVDTDYSTMALPPPSDGNKTQRRRRCIFTSDRQPYTRTALFPWGTSQQKGPDGEKVVSTRAIHHVRELTRIVKGECQDNFSGNNNHTAAAATLLLVVLRGDAQAFQPNAEACPSFARYLHDAHKAGVHVVAKRVSWNERGECWDDHDSVLPILWPARAATDPL